MESFELQPIILQQPKDKLQCHKRYKTTNAYDRERGQCDQCWKEGKTETTHASGAVWQDGVLFRTALPDLLEVEGDTTLIPGAIKDCLKYMLRLYTQCSNGTRVRPEVKTAAKLLVKTDPPARSEVSKKGQSVGRRSTQDAVGLSILLPPPTPPAADTAGSD